MARCFSAKKSKAGKAIKCGRCGAQVEPGETYFYFSVGFRGQKQIRCKDHRPRQSELTGSKLSGAYSAIEGVEDAMKDKAVTLDSIADALESAASEVESVRDEYQESLDNMPENFQQGSTGDEIQQKIDGLEEFAGVLNDAAEEIRGLSEEDEKEEDPLAEARSKAEDAISQFSL